MMRTTATLPSSNKPKYIRATYLGSTGVAVTESSV